jgi:hypothetical protein
MQAIYVQITNSYEYHKNIGNLQYLDIIAYIFDVIMHM